jgi:hypothetical protein
MPEQDYDQDFPQLKTLGFRRTSEPADYNCIAFAVGDLDKWWWPSGREDEYWPLPIPDKVTLQTFVDGFAAVGYLRCSNAEPEVGLDKIALYAVDEENVKHAAKLPAGQQQWQSKLGPAEDIEHSLPGLEGPCYGRVIAYFGKRLNATSQQVPAAPKSA